jgi:2-oxoglutarate ferredoxin oxidoreductase subunit beta
MTTAALDVLKPGDYRSDLKPVWCAGCGDFGVLSSLYRAMAECQLVPHETIVVSGIGCSSRLPGYVSTYGFNGLHGRALPLAMGMKVARPELNVIAVGGDGDGLAIGGNHFLHTARRNVDLPYFMMDNDTYGLTKGQASPSTPQGERSKSTIYGNPEPSMDACEMAICAGATWVGRAFSADLKSTTDLMVRAIRHRGFAFLNIMSPCVTWRGDDQFKAIKAMVRTLPTTHDKTSKTQALTFTSERDVMTIGVLYEVKQPSLIDRLTEMRTTAGAASAKTADIVARYLPR